MWNHYGLKYTFNRNHGFIQMGVKALKKIALFFMFVLKTAHLIRSHYSTFLFLDTTSWLKAWHEHI